MQSLTCDYCDKILELGLKTLQGFSNLAPLSIKKCHAVTAEGAKAFANLVNLVTLDLERYPKIHGGLVHLKGFGLTLDPVVNINDFLAGSGEGSAHNSNNVDGTTSLLPALRKGAEEYLWRCYASTLKRSRTKIAMMICDVQASELDDRAVQANEVWNVFVQGCYD